MWYLSAVFIMLFRLLGRVHLGAHRAGRQDCIKGFTADLGSVTLYVFGMLCLGNSRGRNTPAVLAPWVVRVRVRCWNCQPMAILYPFATVVQVYPWAYPGSRTPQRPVARCHVVSVADLSS
jgi:hypothetical protein